MSEAPKAWLFRVQWPRLLVGLVLLITVLVSAITLLPGEGYTARHAQAQQALAADLAGCRNETLRDIGRANPPIEVLDAVRLHCYEQVRGEGLLSELIIRRSAFVEQAYQGRVVLWMVVAITLSGVALAALQLIMAYHLARGTETLPLSDGEVTLERGKVAVRSSVTGLLILTVSFAFFLVYVLWVYKIEDPQGVAHANSGPVANEQFGVLESASGSVSADQAASEANQAAKP